MANENLKTFGELMKKRPSLAQKAPAYEWQEMALNIIKEFGVPANKRSSVFKVCKQYSKQIIEMALGDTRELCKSGEKWKYFFKVIDIKIKLHAQTSQKITPNNVEAVDGTIIA